MGIVERRRSLLKAIRSQIVTRIGCPFAGSSYARLNLSAKDLQAADRMV